MILSYAWKTHGATSTDLDFKLNVASGLPAQK